MEQVSKFIRNTIQSIIDRSRFGTFRSEDQIQGYFEGRARVALSRKLEYSAEHPTKNKYVRRAGHLELSDEGTRGRIDAVIKSKSGPIAGIEIQYPRGQGLKNRDFFVSHIRNDVKKLTEYDGLRERYLLIFAYNDPPDDISIRRLDLEGKGVKILHLRLAKKNQAANNIQISKIESVPEGWISFDNSGRVRVI